MKFIVDKQTLEDLAILGKFKPNSIFSLFNKVKTTGGERLLSEMFHQPMTDADDIKDRSTVLRYFRNENIEFPFDGESITLMENYLSIGTSGNYLTSAASLLQKKLKDYLLHDDQYNTLIAGLTATINSLKILRKLLSRIDTNVAERARDILSDKRLDWLGMEEGDRSLTLAEIAKCDFLLRGSMLEQIEMLTETIYSLDVYITVGAVARERNFSFAEAMPAETYHFSALNIKHPGIRNAVGNPLRLDVDQNLLFLTGANMAGKSTFMKATGIAIYLAHMGFPVAAEEMEFSVREGLFTSINVADSLDVGHSHFYAEVLRVKRIATEVSLGKNMMVIFDELFKGTNVKDAYDATLSVTGAFSGYRNCAFIISTHIIETGEVLKQQHSNIRFSYLPTIMEGTVPKYTYILTDGITNDRQGMSIIENEKIFDLLRGG